MAEPSAPRGHASHSHTADVIIEAWAPTASGCYEEAIAGFVAVFADTASAPAGTTLAFEVGPGGPSDLLVRLLEEVLVTVEARFVVPTGADVHVEGDRLTGTLTVVPAEAAELTGPVPKGVSYSGLSFDADNGRWRCRMTVDV